MIFKEIAYDSAEYYQSKDVRDTVLRIPLGLRLSEKDVSGEDKQIHLVAMEGERVVGTLLLKPLSADVAQFRMMALLPEYQGGGNGKALFHYGEEIARAKGFTRAEFNARCHVRVFYEKMGYAAYGEEFILSTIPHVKMAKIL